jgi:Uma2 family endonuclease
MLQVISTQKTTWTATDLVDRFGPIPLSRICFDPPPGLAVEDDVLDIRSEQRRLFELVDGTLVEKAMGFEESALGSLLLHLIYSFVRKHDLGFLSGEAGMIRLANGLVRIPDVAFISWDSLPEREIPAVSFLEQAPDLIVDVISPSNTPQEMSRKLQEYFAKGCRMVWYVYPKQREVHVFEAVDQVTVIDENGTLSGGAVLPGFELSVREVFASVKRE